MTSLERNTPAAMDTPAAMPHGTSRRDGGGIVRGTWPRPPARPAGTLAETEVRRPLACQPISTAHFTRWRGKCFRHPEMHRLLRKAVPTATSLALLLSLSACTGDSTPGSKDEQWGMEGPLLPTPPPGKEDSEY